MRISLIAAMTDNRVIGRDGGMPWHLPADLAYFKRTTLGHHVIMGRKTIESFGRPLPRRTNVIISRQSDYVFPGATVVGSLEAGIEVARRADETEVFIGGGQVIYDLALPIAHRIYLTVIHATLNGDTFFPEFDESDWRCVSEEDRAVDEKNEFAMTFRVYERAQPYPSQTSR